MVTEDVTLDAGRTAVGINVVLRESVVPGLVNVAVGIACVGDSVWVVTYVFVGPKTT